MLIATMALIIIPMLAVGFHGRRIHMGSILNNNSGGVRIAIIMHNHRSFMHHRFLAASTGSKA